MLFSTGEQTRRIYYVGIDYVIAQVKKRVRKTWLNE